MNPDARKALAAAMSRLGSENGKLSLEQFVCVLRHFTASGDGDCSSRSNSNSTTGFTSSSSSTGTAFLICKFFDRDGDGFISADDIFSSQALILQRSKLWLRFVFRVYQEAVWYPGRQLNQLNWLSSKGGGKTKAGSGVLGSEGISGCGVAGLDDVVAPPAVISSRYLYVLLKHLTSLLLLL